MKQICSFAWKVFFGSWIGFLLLEFLRPGFVTAVFSVHWFLLAAFICAGVSLFDTSPFAGPPTGQEWRKGGVFSVVIGAILSILVWRIGAAFGDMRIFFALLAFVLPFLLTRVFYP